MSTLTQTITRPQIEKVSREHWLYGPLGGAALAVGLAFAYALVFIVYATIRSSLLPARVQPDAGFFGTAIAYGAALAIATLAITALMAIPAAIVGAVTALILKWLLSVLNPQHTRRRAIIVGSVICFALTFILHLVFQRALGFALSDVIANPETYLLWLGFPSLIYIAAGGAASWELNRLHV